MCRKNLEIIGTNTVVSLLGYENIPAKIDTGADSSALWVSDLKMSESGVLSFVLFDKSSSFFDGRKIEISEYSASIIRSSNGLEEVRYRAKIPTKIGKKIIKINYTLANREKNNFPILIGRHTLKNNFLVDVRKSLINSKKHVNTEKIRAELKENPYKFHKKYFKQGK